mmetsp:Transcript_33992/g.80702  ORF Transcript_33992/g.80702 Transcript_33992/m.80702 type:complete len:217 (+) Transcript_33992:137-787(+)
MALLTVCSTSFTSARRLSSPARNPFRRAGSFLARRSSMRRLGSISAWAATVKPTTAPVLPQRLRAEGAPTLSPCAAAVALAAPSPGSSPRPSSCCSGWAAALLSWLPEATWSLANVWALLLEAATSLWIRLAASSSAFFASSACCRHMLTAFAAPMPSMSRKAPASFSSCSSSSLFSYSWLSFSARTFSRSSNVSHRHLAAAIAASGVISFWSRPE